MSYIVHVHVHVHGLYTCLLYLSSTERCSSVQFGVEDISTYSHLLNVALNYKLCHGKINEALEIGTVVHGSVILRFSVTVLRNLTVVMYMCVYTIIHIQWNLS